MQRHTVHRMLNADLSMALDNHFRYDHDRMDLEIVRVPDHRDRLLLITIVLMHAALPVRWKKKREREREKISKK